MTGPSTMAWFEQEPEGGTATWRYDSPAVGDQLEIRVAEPPGYESDREPVPVIYTLDPFLTMDMVVGYSRLLGHFSSGHIPPTVVVGVGYPTRDPEEFMGRRARDLTPTIGPFPSELPVSPPYGLGGAPAFLSSLVEEVIPEIESRYGARPADRTLIGYSFSGLFGLYTLFHRPETFSRYLLVSPSTWWDDGICFDYEQRWAEQYSDLPARVFLGVGEDEESLGKGWRNEMLPDEAIKKFRMVGRLRELVERLETRNYPNFRLVSAVFADEHHLTVFPAALSRGLPLLFEDAV